MNHGTFEPLKTGRYSVARKEGATHISIPAPFNWFPFLFLSFWLVGWTIGGLAVFRTALGFHDGLTIDTLPGAGSSFLIVWLCMWFLGEVTALYSLLWMMLGRETIIVSYASLRYSKRILGIGRTKNYDLNHIARLRAADTPGKSDKNQASHVGASCIAFDYGKGTVFMAKGLEEGEARSIVDDLTASNSVLKQPTSSHLLGI